MCNSLGLIRMMGPASPRQRDCLAHRGYTVEASEILGAPKDPQQYRQYSV